jgi:hypothetical protein
MIQADRKDFPRPIALGLVAETLFVAVLLHALLALVLVDLRFTTFFDGAHDDGVRFGLREKFFRKRFC